MPARAAGLCLLAFLPFTLSSGPATAAARPQTPAASTQDLLAKVHALQAKVKKAIAAYDAALQGVAVAVSNNVNAQTALTEAERVARDQADAAAVRIRDLYRSGGPMALYATVLDGGSAADVLDRVVEVQRIVGSDQAAVSSGRSELAAARVKARAARAHAVNRVQSAKHVTAIASHLQSLLAQEKHLLDVARARAADVRAAEAALNADNAAISAVTAQRIKTIRPTAMPPGYSALYHGAAKTCPGLSWTVLAAIGQVETGHGRDTNTSSAGAQGPMQFLPSTFAAYAVDGDHDGRKDITDAADAIYTAAHYLCANGAGNGGKHLANAIWHYNHADWYVQLVLTLAKRYAEQDSG
jgi:peptidoglycan hydrolase CwlO-like protein